MHFFKEFLGNIGRFQVWEYERIHAVPGQVGKWKLFLSEISVEGKISLNFPINNQFRVILMQKLYCILNFSGMWMG